MDVVLFGITAVCALAGGAGVIVSRRPVHSALGLLLVLLSLAVDYLLLGAQFIAAAQVIIYAGAIVVLFVFIIMLLPQAGDDEIKPGAFAGLWGAGGPALLVLGALLAAGLVALVARPYGVAALPPSFGAIQDVGRALFGRYLLPFEAASLVLLVGMIGAVALGRRLTPRASLSESLAPPPGRDQTTTRGETTRT